MSLQQRRIQFARTTARDLIDTCRRARSRITRQRRNRREDEETSGEASGKWRNGKESISREKEWISFPAFLLSQVPSIGGIHVGREIKETHDGSA